MTPAFSLVSALLVSQISLVSGQTSPFSKGGSAAGHVLACGTNDGGCRCAAIGAVDNTSNSNNNCTGQSGVANGVADLDNCRADCCGAPTVATCYSSWLGPNGNNSMCGNGDSATMEIDMSKLSMASGATASEQLTNCCKTKAIVTCSQVMCAAKDPNFPPAPAGYHQARTAAGQADMVCTSDGECVSKCCEKNPLMCDGVSASTAVTWCGTNYTVKPLWTSTGGVPPHCWSTGGAAFSTFTVSADNASFKSACCTVKPAKTACPANFACPEHYEKMSPMPTTLWDSPGAAQCCNQKANVTQCSAHCNAGAYPAPFPNPAAAGTCAALHGSSMSACPSSKCGADQLLDASKKIANGATATDATIASTCCFNKPAAIVPAKCSAYFAAALAGEVKAKATIGSAYMQGASLPILAVAMLMLMKV